MDCFCALASLRLCQRWTVSQRNKCRQCPCSAPHHWYRPGAAGWKTGWRYLVFLSCCQNEHSGTPSRGQMVAYHWSRHARGNRFYHVVVRLQPLLRLTGSTQLLQAGNPFGLYSLGRSGTSVFDVRLLFAKQTGSSLVNVIKGNERSWSYDLRDGPIHGRSRLFV